MDQVFSGGREVVIHAGGGFSVAVPDPHAGVRGEVLRGMALEHKAFWQGVREAWPHRSQRMPHRMDGADRERQERSLGRKGAGERQGECGGKTEVCYLHPMGDEVYLLTLAGLLQELAPRVERMRAEMLARPEEFQRPFEGERVFDLALFRECGEAWPTGDEVRLGLAAAESTLAAFVCWVAGPGTMRGVEAAGLVLSGMTWWSERSRWVFGTWACCPWFCYGDE